MRPASRLSHRLVALLFTALAFASLNVQAATATRNSSFVYDPASGLLTKEIIEPNDSQLCLVTEYTYDAFGNKTSVTTRNCNGSAGEAAAPAAGTDGVIQSRTTSSTYDAQGQFATSTTNALGHTETRTFDARFGTVATLTGPNGLTTNWTYDSFGRKTLETRADGTTTAWSYQQTCALAPASGSTGAATVGYCIATTESGMAQPSYAYYDMLNRKLLGTRRNMADSDWIDEGNTRYDSYGRVSQTYLPYERTQLASAKFATLYYDLLGRTTSSTAPDNSVTSTTYAGLTTTVTNSLNQTKTTLKNSQGQTVTITDAQNKTIGYTYDPFGNLTKTTDALGNVTTLTYDARGRKTQMNDPDMGVWQYFYNALGELIRQVDAKNQTVTMAYDKLGRMTTRTEPDLVSTWSYDTAAHGIGKLAVASSDNGYSRTHSYDALGRLINTSTVIDNPATPYVTSTTYDAYGRADTQTYPTGFAVKNVYNTLGYLTQVVNAATPTTVYWTANTMDAQGHLTQQSYGNGLVTQQVYDPATGRMTNQYAGAGNAVQNLAYTYDTLGNLTTRQDVNQSLLETYNYDTLNRLTNATAVSGAVNVATNYAYDAIGNIVCKSDISTCSQGSPNYSYNASGLNSVRPHAVASITGSINGVANPTYTYDANGNMLTGAGRTSTWTSFNIPSQVTNGTKTAAFWYNPEHERTKELQADQSIVITLSPRYDTGIHWEKKYVTDPTTHLMTGVVEYEHYLYSGAGVMFGKYIQTTATDGTTIATTSIEYYSKDNLGSIVAITDGTGAVTQRLSYDAWGKRRYPNGTADPNGLLNNPDMYHGFTGHEMLDDVGLIHMNGRLYDPVMARFLSADPNIQDPFNIQSYNRYSYVLNNPLYYTDPSGYSWWTSIRGIVVRAVAAVADANGCGGYCSAAVGAYQGYQQGGTTGGIVGGITGYASFQVSLNYPLTNQAGSILWQNVATAAMINAASGCASAASTGGNCGQGALNGAAGTVGAAYGLPGALVAGCAAGKIGGGSCSEGALNALQTYAVYSAVGYVVDAQQKGAAASADGALNTNEATAQDTPDIQEPILLAANTLSPGCGGVGPVSCTDVGGPGVGGGGGGGGAARSLGANPFQGRSPEQIDQIFRSRNFEPRGPDPINGKGGYVNPETGRSYHIDPGGTYKKGTELPHVDVNRKSGGGLSKRKYPL